MTDERDYSGLRGSGRTLRALVCAALAGGRSRLGRLASPTSLSVNGDRQAESEQETRISRIR